MRPFLEFFIEFSGVIARTGYNDNTVKQKLLMKVSHDLKDALVIEKGLREISYRDLSNRYKELDVNIRSRKAEGIRNGYRH